MATTYGDRWTVERSLGEGGQAHTYIVRDANVDQTDETDGRYVLKRLKNLKRIGRLEREVEAIERLDHPHVLALVDHDLTAERPYLVTEYCSGGSLDHADPFWRDSPTIALDLFGQICDGVAHAHGRQVIHRDLKPANIFLRDDPPTAVLGDFGLCLLQDSEGERLTGTSEAVGPRLFMAPELEDGRLDVATPSVDIYSLGKLLYWLISGRVFSREQHRKREWDLRGATEETDTGWRNIFLEHVNHLLDLMIQVDPNTRRSISNISVLARETRRLVANEYYPLVQGSRHPCSYCGLGHYELIADRDPTKLRNTGFTPTGPSLSQVYCCTCCGHVQYFRLRSNPSHGGWRSADGGRFEVDPLKNPPTS